MTPTPKRYAAALVGCGAAKRAEPSPASRLYTSTLFRKSLAYAESVAERVWILSALHGALDPARVVAPYDLHLGQLTKREREQWACGRVCGPLPYGEGRTILLLCGEDYAAPVRPELRRLGWVPEAPLGGLQIGERLAWLVRATEGCRQFSLPGCAP